MKVRNQRTHFMGLSNRTQGSFNLNNTSDNNKRNNTTDLFEKSFNKSKSQYYQASNKLKPSIQSNSQSFNKTNNELNKQSYTSQLDFNQLFRQTEKGHHYEFNSKRITSNQRTNKNILQNQSYDTQMVYINPEPLNFNKKLNEAVNQIKQEFSQANDINLFKINELKSTFLRNNQKRRNLKQYFEQFVNKNTGLLEKQGFNKLIREYGYDINENQIRLMFKLNKIHEKGMGGQINSQNGGVVTFGGNNNNNQKRGQQKQGLNIHEFINLMTKENVYFKTLKLNNNEGSRPSGYRFSPPQFEVFRNKFALLKEAFKVYKGEPIDSIKFEKVMKKLDINNLVIKQQKRLQIFNQFQNQQGNLNVQKLLGVIATQQHQRVQKSGNQLKVKNHDNFQQNIQANQQFNFINNDIKDPLKQLIYPINLKKASFVDYERHVQAAKKICKKLQLMKQKQKIDVISQLLCQSGSDANKIKKQNLYKNVQNLLQKQGFNFNKNQYRSFLAFLDFDQNSCISKQNLEKFILLESQKERVDRLDRRKRNVKLQKIGGSSSDKLNEENNSLSGSHLLVEQKQDRFADNLRSKSSQGWNNLKKTYIFQQNLPQFKIPTKFSAWPQRLYQHDLSLLQAKKTTGLGIPQVNRFQKDQKHSFAQQQKLKKQQVYEYKLRKTAAWQDVLDKRVQQNSVMENKKLMQKNYNMRLLKQKYQERCHQNNQAASIHS